MINLNGTWKLYPIEYGKNIQSPEDLVNIPSIKGEVPGNVELDLIKAGLLPEDIFKGMNITLAEKYETFDWWYETEFETPKHERDLIIRFDGVDCVAEYWLNNKKFGESENSLVEHQFKINEFLNTEGKTNKLLVHIKSTVIEANHKEVDMISLASWGRVNFSALRIAPHTMGWDIMPRAVSAGIWKGVYLYEKDEISIAQYHYFIHKVSENETFFRVAWELDIPDQYVGLPVKVVVNGKCKDSEFTKTRISLYKSDGVDVLIKNPYLWWPRGYGEQDMYDVTITAYIGEKFTISKKFPLAIRTVKLDRTSWTDGYNGKFQFLINGEPIMCRGTNWVPLDVYHSRDHLRLKKALEMVCDVGCNIVRCWGGNVYESDEFYDFCDINGIMVWQDFSMACAIHSQREEHCKALEAEAIKVVKRLRIHPSIVLWSGDNECDSAYMSQNLDPTKNKLTRNILAEVVRLNDPTRPYLPSSPCYDAMPQSASDILPEIHLWGPRDYFKSDYYTQSIAHFVSEIGYHGFPNIESIKKFIDADKLWPNTETEQWILHSADQRGNPYRMRLARDQVSQFFGSEPVDMENFVKASQYTQAEAKKYFIERIRCKKPIKTGVIWWNLLDGWPQVSDAVVDYYFSKKEAYDYIKRSQQEVVIILDELKSNRCDIIAVNDTLKEVKGNYRIYNIDTDHIYSEGEFSISKKGVSHLGGVPMRYSDKEFLVIEWTIGGKTFYNHYLCGMPGIDFTTYKRWIAKFKEIIDMD